MIDDKPRTLLRACTNRATGREFNSVPRMLVLGKATLQAMKGGRARQVIAPRCQNTLLCPHHGAPLGMASARMKLPRLYAST
jgi:hypothetical protein